MEHRRKRRWAVTALVLYPRNFRPSASGKDAAARLWWQWPGTFSECLYSLFKKNFKRPIVSSSFESVPITNLLMPHSPSVSWANARFRLPVTCDVPRDEVPFQAALRRLLSNGCSAAFSGSFPRALNPLAQAVPLVTSASLLSDCLLRVQRHTTTQPRTEKFKRSVNS
jgi:hypothetical protein